MQSQNLPVTIIALVLLLPWPIFLLTSPMMFGGPGATNQLSIVVTVMLVLYYPVGVFLFLWLMKWSFFSISSIKLSLISFSIITALLVAIGYFGIFINIVNGIKGSGYSVTSKHVYHDGNILEHADPGSFTAIVGDIKGGNSHRIEYAKDAAGVYYRGSLIAGADVESFHQFKEPDRDYSEYWIDKQRVYRRGAVVENADPYSFHRLGPYFMADKKHVYYDGKLIYNAKATGSTILNGVILKSDNKVFFKNEEIVDADHDSFEYLADYYSKDNKRIYQNKTPILPNANAKTFTLVNDKGRVTYGVDNQYVYIMQGVGVEKRLESLHPDTVQFLGEDYIMDRGTIYYVDSSEEKMSSLAVDTATFNVTGLNWEAQTDAKDKNNLYFHGKIVSAIGTTGSK